MAVRFLPAPEDRRPVPQEDRADLAEVIELRSKITQWGGNARGAADESLLAGESCQPGEPGEPGEPEGTGEAGDEQDTDGDGQSAACEVDPGPDRTCSEDGVRLLARRARSSGELREELLRIGHAPSDVEDVIDDFVSSHYLDDAGLARLVTEKLRETKRASRSQIRVKLRGRRLPDDVIEAAIGELDTDEEFALLREAAVERARKLGGLDRQTAERRLLGFLARRGWSGEPAMRAARKALDGGVDRSHAGSSGGVRFR